MYARRQTRPKPRASQPKKWAAPVAGWVANRALSDPSSIEGPGAAVLENFFPKSTSVALRRGSRTVVQLPDAAHPVGALFSYNNGANEQFFAASTTTIYSVTGVPSKAVPEASDIIAGTVARTGFTGSDWTVVQFATTGGVYLIGVNGKDVGFIYDGTTFTPLSGGTAPTVTFPSGLTSADMAYVWAYKSRLWFARKGTMEAYYLDVDSVGGTADVFPLGGVFGQGGELLFGSAWSLDSSGDAGLTEQCVFVSSEGEVAVFQGANPTSASDWTRVGLYRIGAPLGRRAFIKGGGDLAIATTVGMVPLSKAITLDVTALATASVSYKIADAWSEAVARGATDWQCQIWPEAKMAIVAPKSENAVPELFVSNTETGAWARYTGWDVSSLHTFGGRLFFGSGDGRVVLANASGDDDGSPYTGRLLPLFEDLGAPMSSKIATVGRARVMGNVRLVDRVSLAVEFDINPPVAPDAAQNVIVSEWDYGMWGSAVWSDSRPSTISQEWRSLCGSGYSVSLWYQVTSGAPAPLDAEVIGLEMLFTATEALG
jgi:hypothetical protein